MTKRLLAASCAAWLAASTVGLAADRVLVFGDSLADPGNIPRLTGLPFPPPPYVDNHFSNGPTFAEQLLPELGLPAATSTNFAVGGARTGTGNINNADAPFSTFGIVLPGIQSQVDRFLNAGGRLRSGDLVILQGGANDAFAAAATAGSLPPAAVPGLVQATGRSTGTNLARHVLRLHAAGGEDFVIANLPDLGSTPSFTAQGASGIALGNGLTLASNIAIRQSAVQLQQQTGANILVFDVNGVLRDALANPGRYGLANTTTPCIASAACLAADTATQNRFLFFDGVHPTTGFHGKVATLLAETIQAPATVAAQGDVSLLANQDFQRQLIAAFNPAQATASQSLGRAGTSAESTAQGRPGSVFLALERTDGDRDARDGALGYDFANTALTGGVRYQVAPLVSLGGAMGGSFGETDTAGLDASFNQAQVQLGLSATLGTEPWYITGLVNGGYARIDDIERRSDVAGIAGSGDTDGFVYGAAVAAGVLLPIGDLRAGPIAALRYAKSDLDGYAERGQSFFAQTVKDDGDASSTLGSVGLAAELNLGGVRLHALAAFEHEFEDDERTIVTSIPGAADTTLRTAVATQDPDALRLGGDLALNLFQQVELGAGYETLVGFADGVEHTVFGRLTVGF